MEPRVPATLPANVIPLRGINFLHPGYPPNRNILITLPRFDQAAPNQFGVDHATALLACQVIAANRFTGYLQDKNRQRVSEDVLILLDEEYFFIVDGEECYPIVPSFKDWEFPHNDMPSWPELRPVTWSQGCCITASTHAIQQAHIIPREVRQWYIDQKMKVYAQSVLTIDDEVNLLPMKSDIHCIFEDRWFVIVPKLNEYRVHCINREAGRVDIHNLPLQGLHEGTRYYLLARFAWAILLKVKLFVTEGQARMVRVYVNGKWETSEMAGSELLSRYSGEGLSRKRRRYQDTDMDTDEDDWDGDGDGDGDGDD